MRILDLLLFLDRFLCYRYILFSVLLSDVFSCGCICLLGDSGGIGTQISDDTYCTASLDVNTLV